MQPTVNSAHPTVPSKKRRFKVTDALIMLVMLALIIALAATLLKQLGLRHEVNDARATSDKLITAMQEQDGEAARLLGDPSFRVHNDAARLHQLFTQTKDYTIGTPTVAKQTVNNGKVNRVVSIYYKFNDKKPFYVRVTVLEPNSGTHWSVINFSGNASLNTLTK